MPEHGSEVWRSGGPHFGHNFLPAPASGAPEPASYCLALDINPSLEFV